MAVVAPYDILNEITVKRYDVSNYFGKVEKEIDNLGGETEKGMGNKENTNRDFTTKFHLHSLG